MANYDDVPGETPHIGPHGVGCKCPPQELRAQVGMFARVRHDLEVDKLHPIYELVYFNGDGVGPDIAEDSITDEQITATVQITLNTLNPGTVAAMQLMKESLGDHFSATIDAHTQKMLKEELLHTVLGGLFGNMFDDLLKSMKPEPETDSTSPSRDEF